MNKKQIFVALGLASFVVLGMGAKRVIRGSAWFEQHVSIATSAAEVRDAIGVGAGGGSGSATWDTTNMLLSITDFGASWDTSNMLLSLTF